MRYFNGILFSLVLFATQAHAHPLDLGVLNLVGTGSRIHARLELNPQIGAGFLQAKVAELSPAILDTRKTELFNSTLNSGKLSLDHIDCTWSGEPVIKIENPQLLSIEADALCPKADGALEITLPFLRSLGSSYRLLAMTRFGGTEHVLGADAKNSVLSFSLTQASLGLGHFVWMGVEHIGLAPSEWSNEGGFHFPYGIDHILFVFALILSGGTLIGLLKTITGFTLGHTASLALVTFGAIQISGRWIEAAIALTIAFVSAEALARKQIKHKIGVTFGIGLIHGLGFAAALSGLALDRAGLWRAVLGFNLGVELSQAAIIVLVAPVLFYANRFWFGKKVLTPATSLGILIISLFWFIKRAFL